MYGHYFDEDCTISWDDVKEAKKKLDTSNKTRENTQKHLRYLIIPTENGIICLN